MGFYDQIEDHIYNSKYEKVSAVIPAYKFSTKSTYTVLKQEILNSGTLVAVDEVLFLVQSKGILNNPYLT